jgi:hypothetical protein
MIGLAMMIGDAKTVHARNTATIALVAMMMIVAAAMMVVDVVTVAPRTTSTSPAIYVIFMGIPLVTAGGATKMIALTALTEVIVTTKVQILLLLMELTPTGTTTRG